VCTLTAREHVQICILCLPIPSSPAENRYCTRTKTICLRTTHVGVDEALDASLFLPTVPRVGRLILDVAEEASGQTQGRSRGICGGQSGTETGFSPFTSVFPYQYHPTIAPYVFAHLPPTLHNPNIYVVVK
jgi:hypothetical protein